MKNSLRILFCCIFFISIFISAKAQLIDTIVSSFHTRPKVFFQIATYNSFVSNEQANTFGIRSGLEFNKRVRIGVGFYALTSDIVKQKIIAGASGNDTVGAQLEMGFASVSLEYVFYNKGQWQLSVPLNIGVGKSYFWHYLEGQGDIRYKIDEKSVALMTLSVEAQYKIIKWVGVGAGLGYRQMLKDNSNINENFNSVIYNLGLRIFVDEIFKSIFKKKNNPQ